jgi:hypothetical protein
MVRRIRTDHPRQMTLSTFPTPFRPHRFLLLVERITDQAKILQALREQLGVQCEILTEGGGVAVYLIETVLGQDEIAQKIERHGWFGAGKVVVIAADHAPYGGDNLVGMVRPPAAVPAVAVVCGLASRPLACRSR